MLKDPKDFVCCMLGMSEEIWYKTWRFLHNSGNLTRISKLCELTEMFLKNQCSSLSLCFYYLRLHITANCLLFSWAFYFCNIRNNDPFANIKHCKYVLYKDFAHEIYRYKTGLSWICNAANQFLVRNHEIKTLRTKRQFTVYPECNNVRLLKCLISD